jgi:hypothetical protein
MASCPPDIKLAEAGGRNKICPPYVIPAQAGIHLASVQIRTWIPRSDVSACAGMT